ncbi:MAG: hypothetical protein FWG87_04290 [Defluviitaleaceae bacterium]|nr:hypothetical protein [Defluviitaleaceae bacterium]
MFIKTSAGFFFIAVTDNHSYLFYVIMPKCNRKFKGTAIKTPNPNTTNARRFFVGDGFIRPEICTFVNLGRLPSINAKRGNLGTDKSVPYKRQLNTDLTDLRRLRGFVLAFIKS